MAGPQRPESREGGLIRVAFCYGVGRSHAARVIPVAFYARLFVCLDVACNVFERDILARAEATQVTAPRGAWRDGDTSVPEPATLGLPGAALALYRLRE